MNLFFRNDYGADSITYPVIPETSLRTFEEFRLRAGKNDISNPFIRDELTRRLYTDMGQVGAVGTFVSLYLNGAYKGYYNLTERLREPFMQAHHQSREPWDVYYIGVFENGDDTHFNTVLNPRLRANLSVKANYDALAEVLDLTNAADYYLLNIYTATWDWPQNNWAMARERSDTGLWRYYVWDAEGAFGMSAHTPSFNKFTNSSNGEALLSGGGTVSANFQRLMTSAEWRLLFADRIQKHLFNNGALTDARVTARRNACQDEVRRLMSFAGLTPDTAWFTTWLNATSGRKRYLFPRNAPGQAGYQAGQFRDPNGNGNLNDTLWPLTLPPSPSLPPGEAPAGSALMLEHTAPEGSVIYYTLDGADPRVWGGEVAEGARVYTGPLTLASSTLTVKARVRNGETGEWSPLTEAFYHVGTVPASADNLVVAEMMYHPPDPTAGEIAAGFADPEAFEFLSLRNIGATPVDLSGLRFVTGITFDFATVAKTVLDPGRHIVIGKSLPALLQRYGAGLQAVWGGEYFGNLANSGERLRLETTAGSAIIKEFTFSDDLPWPKAADGQGSSLVLLDPAGNPDHNTAASWKASDVFGGTPLGATAPAATYETWAAATFTAAELADLAVSGPLADADGDGWSNQFEFALGSLAKASNSRPDVQWTWAAGEGGAPALEVTLRRRAGLEGVTVSPQWSTDLATWADDFALLSTIPAADDTEITVWRKQAAPATPHFFGRLHAPTAP